jgi:glycosidase
MMSEVEPLSRSSINTRVKSDKPSLKGRINIPMLKKLLFLLLSFSPVFGQSINITFRYIPENGFNPIRVFVPGEFNNWGPNSSGVISPTAVSLMNYDAANGYWYKTLALNVGSSYQYKMHFHKNQSGSDWQWVTDPINTKTVANDPNGNSIMTVSSPMVFQLAKELDTSGKIKAISAGIFRNGAPFSSIEYEINGARKTDGLTYYNAATGIFRYPLPTPVVATSQFKVIAKDGNGATVSDEQGTIQKPVVWLSESVTTNKSIYTVRGTVSRPDGTIDPNLTTATVSVNGKSQSATVTNGTLVADVSLQSGANEITFSATVDGQTYVSDVLKLTRRITPNYFSTNVSGTNKAFQINFTSNPNVAGLTYSWTFDETNSTTKASGLVANASPISGQAADAGELYFNVTATAADGTKDIRRIAVIVQKDGTSRAMQYAETPSWVNKSVVYEIFPLTFGSISNGTEASPSTRFKEITANLDYLRDMGFNTLWFMPIFKNQFMDPTSAGYNITDFYNVDPKLGTNADFKVLVQEAHKRGIKIILDITPNHVSPIHAWTESVRKKGINSPYYTYLQTTFSNHDKGGDGRGPNLPQTYQTENGKNIYVKYDGFGDLANVNWDDDDLQAAFLDIFEYWIREFDIDGYRFDVWWGPHRRYGNSRFGTPIRERIKRIKPDVWLLGEIEGTGTGTEAAYANPNTLQGGIDAGYDWTFYGSGIKGAYGNLSNYNNLATNYGYNPTPYSRYFRFLENHDEARIAKSLSQKGLTAEAVLPLSAFLLTTSGIPMVYQGQEVNYGNVSGDERRSAVTWATKNNKIYASHYQKLAFARQQFAAFQTQELIQFGTGNTDVYGVVRPLLDENAVVLMNFANASRKVSLSALSSLKLSSGSATYFDLFNNNAKITQSAFDVDLAPYETRVFIVTNGKSVALSLPKLPNLPYSAVYTATEGENLPLAFHLDQNYPNPFTQFSDLRFTIATSAKVNLTIFDVLGRKVETLVDEEMATGTHEVRFEAKKLPSGVYFAQFKAGAYTQTQKIVLMK